MALTVDNLKATFDDFLSENRVKKELQSSSALMHIFEMLNEDEAIIKAIDYSLANKPALNANVQKVENYVASLPNNDIDLTNDKIRQTIGQIQKTILAPFGYTPVKSKRLINSTHFTSAACYEKTMPGRLKVVKTIAVI